MTDRANVADVFRDPGDGLRGYELAIERGGGPVIGLGRLPAAHVGGDWSVRPLTVDDLAFAAAGGDPVAILGHLP